MQTLSMTRILASLIIANFVSLVILNLFEMKTYNVCGVYAISGVSSTISWVNVELSELAQARQIHTHYGSFNAPRAHPPAYTIHC